MFDGEYNIFAKILVFDLKVAYFIVCYCVKECVGV